MSTLPVFMSLYAMTILRTTNAERLVFGSCNNAHKQSLWQVIESVNPQKLILLGDNIYLDDNRYDKLTPQEKLKLGYKTWLSNPQWTSLLNHLGGWKNCMVTYDDHDFGRDNCDRHLEFKNLSQQYFWDNTQVPRDSPQRMQNGVFSSRDYIINEMNHPDNVFKYKVIMLDIRSNKDKKGTRNGGFIGYQQQNWLIEQLKDAYEYDFIIIGSSIQVLRTDALIEESWAEFVEAREKLLTLLSIANSFSNVIILSGDVHHAEISSARCKDFSQANPITMSTAPTNKLWDFTSSGLTHSVTLTADDKTDVDMSSIWSIADNSTVASPLIITRSWFMTFLFHLYQALSPRPHREFQYGDYYAGLNFGVIDIVSNSVVDKTDRFNEECANLNPSDGSHSNRTECRMESQSDEVSWYARVSVLNHKSETVLHRQIPLKRRKRTVESKKQYDALINDFESNYGRQGSHISNPGSVCEPFWGELSPFRMLLTRFVICLILFVFVVAPLFVILWLVFASCLYIFYEREVRRRKRVEDFYQSVTSQVGGH